jgi:hypothetical protein
MEPRTGRREALRLALAGGAWLAAGRPALGDPAPRRFVTGYAGALPKDKRDLARTYFSQTAVRALIYALEAGPLSVEAGQARLAGSPATLDDLLRLRLVRREGDHLRLGFAYFTAADMRLIHQVAADHVRSLVAAYRAQAAAFRGIWARYPVNSVNPARLAFTVVAGVGLNWDGLDLLEAGGWRKPLLVSGPGWRYSFFASEDTPDYSYKGYYWGSSAFPADQTITPPMPLDFVSFGDPQSDPRMNFPDLLDMAASDMTQPVRAAAEGLGSRKDQMPGPGVLGIEAGRQIGRLLLALRARSATAAELQAGLPGDPVPAEVELLRRTAYVRDREDGRIELTAPVLDLADKPMLESARALNRAILRRWLIANYAPVCARLTGLTALRQGVAYEALFTQIWHELFGLVTRELVAEGLVADPYAPGNPSPGSLALAYRPELIVRVWR